jgi:hypothetical protein
MVRQMTTFRVCWPDSNPDHWIEIEAFDAEQAAELGASAICERENECYSSFENDGETIHVVDPDPAGRGLQSFKVSVEFEPVFRAREGRDGE